MNVLIGSSIRKLGTLALAAAGESENLQKNGAQGLKGATHPCAVMLASPTRGDTFTYGTTREIYDYVTSKHNLSIVDVDAGRERFRAGSVVFSAGRNQTTMRLLDTPDVKKIVLHDSDRTPHGASVKLTFTGKAAEQFGDLLRDLPLGGPWWVSDETPKRRMDCQDATCKLESYDWPGNVRTTASMSCPAYTETDDPQKYLLADAMNVFAVDDYKVVNHKPAKPKPDHVDALQLMSNSSYTESPGCYLACYSVSGLGVHQVARGIWLAGQIRVPGKYEAHLCRPTGANDADACEQFEACSISPCWIGADTGGWFNSPVPSRANKL